MSTTAGRAERAHHHDDAPGARAEFELLTGLPAGPQRQKRILQPRFLRDATRSRLGGEPGVPRTHVSPLLAHTFRHVREHVEAEAVDVSAPAAA